MVGPQKIPHLVHVLALLSGVFQTDRCTARSVISTRILSPQCQRLSLHFPFLPSTKRSLPTPHITQSQNWPHLIYRRLVSVFIRIYLHRHPWNPKTLFTSAVYLQFTLCSALYSILLFKYPWGFGFLFITIRRLWMMTRLEAWPNTPKSGSWSSEFIAGRGK